MQEAEKKSIKVQRHPLATPCEGGAEVCRRSYRHCRLETCSTMRSLHDEAQEATGDVDDFKDLLAGEVFGDARFGSGGLVSRFLIGARAKADLAAHFAVNLHSDFDFRLDEER